MAELRRWTRVLLFTIFPLISGLLAIPIVASTSAKDLFSGELHPLLVSIIAAFYLGLAAAPGYIFAAFLGEDLSKYSRPTRLWVRVSLLVGLIVALAASGYTFVAFWPLVIFPGVTVALTVWLYSSVAS